MTETNGLQSLKYLLSGPFQKNLLSAALEGGRRKENNS